MDISIFSKEWINENHHKEGIEKFWDSRAGEFNKKEKTENDLVEYLFSRNIIDKNSDVLDIGCGPGKYAIEFAKKCKNVVGLDVSDKMLKHARENTKIHQMQNIEFKKCFWDEVNLKKNELEKNFDLVFASMCPGINNEATLNKMMQASKKYCFMSGFAERKNPLWDKVNEEIGMSINKFFDKKIYYGFNILYLKGYFPEIKYVDAQWSNLYSLDHMVNQYIARFEMNNPLEEEKKEKIYDYLKNISENGYVREETKSKIAWIIWKVN